MGKWIVSVVTILGIFGGGVAWMTEVHSLARANSRELIVIREYTKTLKSIDTRLARLEGALGVKVED